MLSNNKLQSWKAYNQMGVMPPVSTRPPVVAGSPLVGISLSLDTGSWLIPPSSFDIQWYVNDVPAVGKTSLVFGLLSVLNIGQKISAKVTANNSFGSTEVFSNSVTILAV